MTGTTEKSLYSRTAYREILNETIRYINQRNKNCKDYTNLTLIELAKDLVDHKLLPSSLYHEINGKGSSAIIPRQICNAMLKNKQKRCSRSVKKPGDEFCFHHTNLINQGGSIKTWDEYQAMKNKNYKGKRIKKQSLSNEDPVEEFKENTVNIIYDDSDAYDSDDSMK